MVYPTTLLHRPSLVKENILRFHFYSFYLISWQNITILIKMYPEDDYTINLL